MMKLLIHRNMSYIASIINYQIIGNIRGACDHLAFWWETFLPCNPYGASCHLLATSRRECSRLITWSKYCVKAAIVAHFAGNFKTEMSIFATFWAIYWLDIPQDFTTSVQSVSLAGSFSLTSCLLEHRLPDMTKVAKHWTGLFWLCMTVAKLGDFSLPEMLNQAPCQNKCMHKKLCR